MRRAAPALLRKRKRRFFIYDLKGTVVGYSLVVEYM